MSMNDVVKTVNAAVEQLDSLARQIGPSGLIAIVFGVVALLCVVTATKWAITRR
jgi:hypothetical protein